MLNDNFASVLTMFYDHEEILDFDILSDKKISTMWGYPEWANDPYYYDMLTDG